MASPFYLKHRERTACPGSCLVFFARAGSAFIRLHAWICEHLALVSSLTLVMLLCAAVGKYAMQDAGDSQHAALILISVQNIFMVIFPMVCAIACTRLSPGTATKLSSLAPSVFFVYVFHPIGIMLFYHSIPASIENSTLLIINGLASEKSARTDRFCIFARRIKQKPRLMTAPPPMITT